VLAACGDDDEVAPQAEPAGEEGGSRTRIAGDGEPQEGGTLTVLVPSYLDNLDVQTQTSYNPHDQAGPVYSRLLAFAVGEDVEYGEQVLEPDLAESWEISDDDLTYTFHLRDDVTWHDLPPVNGRPFVAGDVVASMNRVKTEGAAAYMLDYVEEIVATDDHTVEFRLSAPFAPLLNYLASHYMWILPEEATIPVEQGGFDPRSTAIGTGPFIMTEVEPNVRISYERNPDYYGEGPYLDGFERVVMPDQGARIAAFRTGAADMISGLSPEEDQQLQQTTPEAVTLELMAGTHLMVFVNVTREPMSDLLFRKAISAAIDREGLGRMIYGGGQLSGPVVGSLGKWALSQDELAELYPYDPDLARRYLEQSGVADPTVGLLLTNGYGEQVVRAAQWVAEDLSKVGITAEVEVAEYAAYYPRRPSLQYDITVGLQTPFTEPDEWLRSQHQTGASRNFFGISDPQLDEMLVEQLTLTDEDERVELVHDTQRYIAEQVLSPIPLWNYRTTVNVSGRVRDYFPDALYGEYEYRLIWLDQEG
jgi:peptide/nickel transport system substrate-binding protein